jgi:hypothetical protein
LISLPMKILSSKVRTILSKSRLLGLRFGFKDHIYSQVMVLKLVFGKRNMYERLGIAECPHWWFGGQAKRIVELFSLSLCLLADYKNVPPPL